ncbi:MAG: hypothetical protein K9M57_03955 [Phycisphaerae bacterium]|nr:hypothetical protein [Phycisphaerae bacterium]
MKLDAYDLGVTVTGPGTLIEVDGGPEDIANHQSAPFWSYSSIQDNSLTIAAGQFFAEFGDVDLLNIPQLDLFWGLAVRCDGPGSITVDLVQGLGDTVHDGTLYGDEDLGDLTITVLNDIEILDPVTLTTKVTKGNGQISPATADFEQGSTITLTATPDAGYRVKSWKGADDKTSRLTTNTVTLDRKKTVAVTFEPIPADFLKMAVIKAGKSRDINTINDSVNISGTLSATQQDISDATEIAINIGTAGQPDIETILFDQDDRFIKLKNNMGFAVKGNKGQMTLFTFNLARGTFKLIAQGLDLTGLTSEMTLDISFGSYQHTFTPDETRINGKGYLPAQFLANTDFLRLEKASVNKAATTLTAFGSIATQSPIDLTQPGNDLTLSWGDQSFTIPSADFKKPSDKRNLYIARNVRQDDNSQATATFDLDKLTFKIQVKKATNLQNSGSTTLTIQAGPFTAATEYLFP